MLWYGLLLNNVIQFWQNWKTRTKLELLAILMPAEMEDTKSVSDFFFFKWVYF